MKKLLLSLTSLAFFMIACHKPVIYVNGTIEPNSMYVLNEGVWHYNNSSISYYHPASGEFTADIFSSVNNRGLGDTGNDLQEYGSRLYCVVNTSENIQVMDLYTAQVIGTVPLIGKSPRKICFSGDKAYVSCFDGTVIRIDTATLAVEATVPVGPNPEGVCIANGKLYVAISGGYNAPDYGTSVAVIDLSNFSVIKNIEVAINPTRLFTASNQQYIYLISNGNYINIHSCLQKINIITDEVVRTFDFEITNMCIYGNIAYLYSSNFDPDHSQYSIQVLDLTSETIINSHFISDGTELQIPYGIAVDPETGDIFVTDAHNFQVNGDVYCFGQDGKKKYSFEAEINPSIIVFLK